MTEPTDRPSPLETGDALAALGALSQETRLNAFRLLVRHEPDGLPAGEIARLLEVPQNTMSTHLAVLVRAGLVSQRRTGRTIIHNASFAALRDLTLFLVKDCCAGNSQLCAPLVAELVDCQ